MMWQWKRFHFHDENEVVVNFHDENDVVVGQHWTVMNSQHSRRDVRGRDEA